MNGEDPEAEAVQVALANASPMPLPASGRAARGEPFLNANALPRVPESRRDALPQVPQQQMFQHQGPASTRNSTVSSDSRSTRTACRSSKQDPATTRSRDASGRYAAASENQAPLDGGDDFNRPDFDPAPSTSLVRDEAGAVSVDLRNQFPDRPTIQDVEGRNGRTAGKPEIL